MFLFPDWDLGFWLVIRDRALLLFPGILSHHKRLVIDPSAYLQRLLHLRNLRFCRVESIAIRFHLHGLVTSLSESRDTSEWPLLSYPRMFHQNTMDSKDGLSTIVFARTDTVQRVSWQWSPSWSYQWWQEANVGWTVTKRWTWSGMTSWALRMNPNGLFTDPLLRRDGSFRKPPPPGASRPTWNPLPGYNNQRLFMGVSSRPKEKKPPLPDSGPWESHPSGKGRREGGASPSPVSSPQQGAVSASKRAKTTTGQQTTSSRVLLTEWICRRSTGQSKTIIGRRKNSAALKSVISARRPDSAITSTAIATARFVHSSHWRRFRVTAEHNHLPAKWDILRSAITEYVHS